LYSEAVFEGAQKSTNDKVVNICGRV
jgi:hypothetical protein